ALNNLAVTPLLTKFGIDDIDPISGQHVDPDGNVLHNPAIDTQAAFAQDTTQGLTIRFKVYKDDQAPLVLGGLPRALGTMNFPLTVSDASGDDTPRTVFQKGALRISYDFSEAAGSLSRVVLEALQNGVVKATLDAFKQIS